VLYYRSSYSFYLRLALPALKMLVYVKFIHANSAGGSTYLKSQRNMTKHSATTSTLHNTVGGSWGCLRPSYFGMEHFCLRLFIF